jgi:hypothetical protein
MKAFMGVALALAAASASSTEVYSTFNTDEQNLFDCCNYLTIAHQTPDQDRAAVAIPFTPEAYAKITEVDVAVSGTDVHDLMKISINGSEAGLPGREKKAWSRTPPMGGQCCTFVALTDGKPVAAAAGGHYWIIVKGRKATNGGWNLNTTGSSGPYAVMGADGVWAMTEGPLPAVRIIAK